MVKNLPASVGDGFDPWVRKIPWGRKCQPTPVSLPGKFHGQWSLVAPSPQGHKESVGHALVIEHTGNWKNYSQEGCVCCL